MLRFSSDLGGLRSPGTPLRLFILLLSVFYSVTFVVLMFLHEVRVDVYVSLYILEYFVLYSVLSPIGARADRYLSMLSYILFTVFIIIVSYRVLVILGYM